MSAIPVIAIIGPTGSGKSARAVEEARKRGGEVISVDSRQVYRGLDIGTEKITAEEMQGVPHHLIDIRDAEESYSAHDFVTDATILIQEIHARGKVPILAGGSHFYFDALFNGLPAETPPNRSLRLDLETLDADELYARVLEGDPYRASKLDPKNTRRLIRAIEIIEAHGKVPTRTVAEEYDVEWILVQPPLEELRERITKRLERALEHGLIEEVERVCAHVGDVRLTELGLEYRIVGEYLRGELSRDLLLPTLTSALWQYARRQRAWVRKLSKEN